MRFLETDQGLISEQFIVRIKKNGRGWMVTWIHGDRLDRAVASDEVVSAWAAVEHHPVA